MIIVNGKYAAAHIMTNDIEASALEQIQELTNAKVAENSKIAIMPDVHAGKGCVIGTVMSVHDRVVPNLVGVDIGCGVYAYKIGEKDIEIDFEKLQRVINQYIPSGRNVHKDTTPDFKVPIFEGKFVMPISEDQSDYFYRSIGTLGGGNHFISVEIGETGAYLLIHSGSRNLGVMVAKYYQDIAIKNLKKVNNSKLIADLKAAGRQKEIPAELKKIAKPESSDLAYLEGEDTKNYLKDMATAQTYAHLNRAVMAETIFHKMDWKCYGSIQTVHNYIDIKRGILRKGAVAAYENEDFLVPLNMRDGTLIFVAEEERPDWLYSAPHGAGRRFSRTEARKTLDMATYEQEMEGIWSASVNESTLDEAPDAYKEAGSIKTILEGVYSFIDHLKPVFNFKAND